MAHMHAGVMAKPRLITTIVSDSFNRSNGSIGVADTGQTWTTEVVSTWEVISNQARLASATTQATIIIDSGVSDCTVSATLPVVGDAGLVWRSTNSSNHFVINASTGQAFRKQAGSFTLVGTASSAWSNGDTIAIVLSGSSHTILRNGVSVLSYTDSFNSTATRHGLRSNSSTVVRFDDFLVTTP